MTGFEQTKFEDTGTFTRLMKHSDRCEGLTNMVIDFAKGAAGIPAFHVSTPAWAKGNSNHTWTGIRTGNRGIDGIFSINSAYPDETDPRAFQGAVAAKVYASGPFGSKEDLTSSFTDSGDLTIEEYKLRDLPDGSDVYLNVINYAIPVTVAGTTYHTGSAVTFRNVGNKTGIVYLVSRNKNNWINPGYLAQIAEPLIFNQDDSVTYLSGSHDPERAGKCSIKIGQLQVKIEAEKSYILSQWKDGRFRDVGTFYSDRTTGNEFVVPLNQRVLYFLHEAGSAPEESDLGKPNLYEGRPFVVLGGNIVEF